MEEITGPITKLFVFIFGILILFIIYSLSKSSRISQEQEMIRRQEQQRKEEENAIKIVEKHRKRLIDACCRNGLTKVLQASDFKILSNNPDYNEDEKIETSGCTSTDEEEQSMNDQKVSTLSLVVPEGRDEMMTIDEKECNEGNIGIDSNICNDTKDKTIEAKRRMDLERNDTFESDVGELRLERKNSFISLAIVCPICLEQYKEGDTVVLSGNHSCIHGFHEHCIMDYLVRNNKGIYSCPCCRQIFLPKEVLRSGWKKETFSSTT